MEFNCNSNRQDIICGFPPGFCDMMLEGNPKHKVNCVRIYQNKNEQMQKVGCSIPERILRGSILKAVQSY